MDPKEYVIVPVKAFGRETVKSLAHQYGALAAINGEFWKPNGTPAGALKIHHKWHGIPSFLTKKHPRTAVGIKENGDWVFVVVDGNPFTFFGGMTIKNLAKLMVELGCIDALNLDGGGSSTMVLEGTTFPKKVKRESPIWRYK